MLGRGELGVRGDDRLGPCARASSSSGASSGRRATRNWPQPRLARADQLALACAARRSISARRKPSECSTSAPQPRRAAAARQRKQRRGCSPRPTRPRSWCSWEMPKRSAFSISITVAFGTSMPTSITVVATSTSALARRRTRHRLLLLARAHPAVQQRQLPARELALAQARQLGRGRPQPVRGRAGGSPRGASPASASSISGQTTYAWRPAASSARSCS